MPAEDAVYTLGTRAVPMLFNTNSCLNCCIGGLLFRHGIHFAAVEHRKCWRGVGIRHDKKSAPPIATIQTLISIK